ncbi:MAG: hypothetical protein Q9172_007125 [Xanthocarpia lactea]
MAQTRVSSWGFVNTILITVFSAFVFKWLLQTTLGWYLRRRTAPRRSSILARVKIEEAQSSTAASHSSESDNGEWEKVERQAIGSAQNGEEADNEWEVMLVEEESAFYGQPSKQPRSDGRERCAVCIQEIMRPAKVRCLRESRTVSTSNYILQRSCSSTFRPDTMSSARPGPASLFLASHLAPSF